MINDFIYLVSFHQDGNYTHIFYNKADAMLYTSEICNIIRKKVSITRSISRYNSDNHTLERVYDMLNHKHYKKKLPIIKNIIPREEMTPSTYLMYIEKIIFDGLL
jgi:TRAP-type mannitol/chloroaromatic compound transport system substrate-binding protein